MTCLVSVLTMVLLPVSSDLTGDSGLEAALRRRQADGLHRDALLGTLPTFGLQLQQGCKTVCKELLKPNLTTEASEDLIIPMSLLKFPSLLSNPSWTMISSTLNACSAVGSLSFRAFFPRMTEKRRILVWELKHKFTSPINRLSLSTCCEYSKWPHFLPVREAVGGCDDPAGWDQTPATAENLHLGLAAPKYGSDPRVGFHSGDGSTHDLHLLSPGVLATCRLRSWGIKTSSIQPRAKAWKWMMSSVTWPRISGFRRRRGWKYKIREFLIFMKHGLWVRLSQRTVERECTYTTQIHSVEYHSTPTPAAGFPRRNTTDAVCSEDFCGENTSNSSS